MREIQDLAYESYLKVNEVGDKMRSEQIIHENIYELKKKTDDQLLNARNQFVKSLREIAQIDKGGDIEHYKGVQKLKISEEMKKPKLLL